MPAYTQVGYAVGICPRCKRPVTRPIPQDEGVCECWKYCSIDHGSGLWSTLLVDFDISTLESMALYAEKETMGGIMWGDLKHPRLILKKCPVCEFLSAQEPITVKLSPSNYKKLTPYGLKTW